MHIPLSIVIPVKNDAKNLASCLSFLDDFDDVTIVDSASSDDTAAVAAAWKRPVVQFAWNGKFPKKRNWALRNLAFKHPWVLFLDADERITPAWKAEVAAFLASDVAAACDVLVCTYDNWFGGRMLRHGDAMRKTAAVRVGAAEYEKIDEDRWSKLDMEIHEHLQPLVREDGNGSKGPCFLRAHSIAARLEHHDTRSLESHWAKHLEYAKWETGRYRQLVAHPERWAALTERQRRKYSHITAWWLAPAYFVVCYFLKRGFLDGLAGLRFAAFKFRYFHHVRRCVLDEM